MEKIIFRVAAGDPIVLSRAIPEYLQSAIIPGSIVLSAQDWYGTLLYQVIKFRDCYMGYWLFDCKNTVSFTVQRDRSFTLLLMCLAQPSSCFFNGLGHILLPTHGHYLLHLSELDAVLHCLKNNRYRYIGLEFTPAIYTDFSREDILLQPFQESITRQQSACYLYTATFCAYSNLGFINALLAADYTSRAKLLYGSVQTRALLGLLLGEKSSALLPPTTPPDVLLRLRDHIHDHPGYAPDFSVAAVTYHTSKAKLIKDFKALFDLPPYQYWQYYRMQFYATRQIMETHKKVKSLVMEMGFGKEAGNFNRKFKSYCGVTASRYKKMYS